MNRYVVEGLLLDAAQGKTVLVLAHTHDAARQAFDEFAGYAEGLSPVKSIRLVNGDERIAFESGGWLVCASLRDRTRLSRLTADRVFMDWPVDAIPDAVAIAAPLVREGGELHRA